MRARAAGRPVLRAGQGAGTGLGAAMLAGPVLAARDTPDRVLPETDGLLTAYVREWLTRVGKRAAPYAIEKVSVSATATGDPSALVRMMSPIWAHQRCITGWSGKFSMA